MTSKITRKIEIISFSILRSRVHFPKVLGVFRLFYNIIIALVYPVYLILSKKNEKVRSFRRTRLESLDRFYKHFSHEYNRCVIWLHASSVGEFDQALGVLREIKSRNPDQKVVISVFSLSVQRTSHPEADFVFHLPLDFGVTWKRMIPMMKVRTFITMTWDIFPNLLYWLQRSHVPSYLCSGALDHDSYRLKFPGKQLFRSVYDRFSGIGAVDNRNREYFLKILNDKSRVMSTGDSRFDTILYKIKNTKLNSEYEAIFKSIRGKLMILGSTYESCESEIFPHLPDLLRDHPGWKILIFPHHTEEDRLISIEKRAREHGLETVRFSSGKISPDIRVIIVDVMGILALAYKKSELCYVGGGFHHRIHNVGEPAALGNPVLTGPRIETSPVALDLEKLDLLARCKNGAEVIHGAAMLMDDAGSRKQIAQKSTEYIESNAGSSRVFYDTFLVPLLGENQHSSTKSSKGK